MLRLLQRLSSVLLLVTAFHRVSETGAREVPQQSVDELWDRIGIEDKSVVSDLTPEQQAASVELVCGICHVVVHSTISNLAAGRALKDMLRIFDTTCDALPPPPTLTHRQTRGLCHRVIQSHMLEILDEAINTAAKNEDLEAVCTHPNVNLCALAPTNLGEKIGEHHTEHQARLDNMTEHEQVNFHTAVEDIFSRIEVKRKLKQKTKKTAGQAGRSASGADIVAGTAAADHVSDEADNNDVVVDDDDDADVIHIE